MLAIIKLQRSKSKCKLAYYFTSSAFNLEFICQILSFAYLAFFICQNLFSAYHCQIISSILFKCFIHIQILHNFILFPIPSIHLQFLILQPHQFPIISYHSFYSITSFIFTLLIFFNSFPSFIICSFIYSSTIFILFYKTISYSKFIFSIYFSSSCFIFIFYNSICSFIYSFTFSTFTLSFIIASFTFSFLSLIYSYTIFITQSFIFIYYTNSISTN